MATLINSICTGAIMFLVAPYSELTAMVILGLVVVIIWNSILNT